MRVDDDRVAAGDHADGVPGDRRQAMGDGSDRADHSKRRSFDHRQPVITAVGFGLQKLDAGRLLAKRA